MNKKAFTLVELIVVITILAILGTIAFMSLQGYTTQAKGSKIVYDIANLNSAMQMKLSRGADLDDLVIIDRIPYNGVDTGATVTVGSGSYFLKDLKYEVGKFDFTKLKMNGDEFVYDDKGQKRDYMFAYIKSSKKLCYEFAGQIFNQAGKYNIVIKGNYIPYSDSDTRGLISQSGSLVGLKNGDTLTGSLY